MKPALIFAQCILCREALSSGGGQGLIRGFYLSVLLLVGVSLTLLAVLGLVVWRGWRPHARERR